MNVSFIKALLCAGLMALGLAGPSAQAVDPALEVAPSNGFAGMAGGTLGGSAAASSQIYTVTNRTELLNAIANGGTLPKIIKVVGTIDMSNGTAYTSASDQSTRGAIRLKSNTTLIGDGTSSGFINGHVILSNVSQIIIRNLKFVTPCDVAPVWDPTDGSSGNWNAAYDSISISGSDHIWIDHNTFTDAPKTDDTLTIENGMLKQCHDGLVDITDASDYVTLSYNNFGMHNKSFLIGNSDSATGDSGKLHVTFHNNIFSQLTQRSPRIRFGQVHLYNNYYLGSQTHPVYPNDYSIGAGKSSQIISDYNAFEITFSGKATCDKIIVNPTSSSTAGLFKDTGSTLNGTALTGCSLSNAVTWTVPYSFTPRATIGVKALALAQAGSGKLATAVTGTGNVSSSSSSSSTSSSSSSSSSSTANAGCPASGLYFCDDFETGTADKWDLLPVAGPNGSFAVNAESASNSNKVLQYTAVSTGGILALVKSSAFTGVTSPDYYLEARIKPQTNSTTGNKFLFLVTRYVDSNNWYGAGLNVQSSTSSTQVEIAKMLAGSLSRPKQVKKPISMDTTWYTVRFELIGTTLTVYLDGEKIGSVTDASFAARGLIGLYTANKSFQIDDIRVGDPNIKPVQLTLSPSTTWSAEAGDAARVVTVTAVKSDGVTADTFSVVSSNPAVVGVSVSGNTVTLTPLAAGSANIVFQSGSDATLSRTISATIAPAFVQPTQTYSLGSSVVPAAGDATAYVDGKLSLTFDSAPTLTTSGSVRIFRKSDNALIDVIKPTGETNTLGYSGQSNVRVINTPMISISGNTAVITPHQGKLAYGTEYYVAVADGVFTGTTLGGTPFVGIGAAGNWSFTTKAAPAAGLTTLTVDDDGTTADFRSVQGALNYVMQNVAAATAATVNVKNGVYDEALYLRGKNNLTIVGESRDGTIIQFKNYETLNSGSGASQAAGSGSPAGGRAVFMIETSDLLTLDNLTLKNTTLRSSSISAQAETIYFNNDTGRLIAKNANFYSEQDTIQVKGYTWFYNTLIAGNVDFIWGGNRVALFENSEIRSVGDTSNTSSGGYVVQARTVASTDKGFIFLNSTLTNGVGPGGVALPLGVTYLARSPGGTASWDNVTFINCKMDTHVATIGWAGLGVNGQPAPNPTTPTATTGWKEYGTMDTAGNAVSLSGRVGGRILTDTEAAVFATRAAAFSAISWNPVP
ncbi:family 16 glycoside hydrolase [Viridibacterium curvum]|uniref:Pectate lyase domain-containing protein n=1 Tax=Viridibacterium curvum TaxID=1101404 RepID=A0ABP9Q6Z4_9RHOO